MFVIDRQYMLHKEGTKFYQVLRILNKSTGDAVTVTNWGKQAGPEGWRTIVSRGQKKIDDGDSYAAAILAKENRGYRKEIKYGFTANVRNLEDLNQHITSELGISEVSNVLQMLGVEAAVPSVEADHSSARSAARTAVSAHVNEADDASAELDGWGEF